MAEKIRVYQLAKDLDIPSKDLIDILQKLGFDVKSHMSSIEGDISDLVLDQLTQSHGSDTEITNTKEQKTDESDVNHPVIEEEEAEGDGKKLKSGKKKKSKIITEPELEEVDEEAVPKKWFKDDRKKPKKQADAEPFEYAAEKAKFLKKHPKDKKFQKSSGEKLPLTKKISIVEPISVKDLAERMEIPGSSLIKEFMHFGLFVNINQLINAENASRVAENFGIEIEVVEAYIEEVLEEVKDSPEELVSRPPVVTIMGHVDHGKTSLLDVIRESNVTATEAGGITQSIGAYQVSINDKLITFIDTPGHEAFTQMRARGANITDIVILVVAADDGIMPQTQEAINHARAASKVNIIVAINKIDLPQANVDKVKNQLSEMGLVSDEWGGDTIIVPVSARTKEGIPELLDMILLVSEMADLKANPDKRARGTVLEARLDKQRGPVATVVIQSGTLKEGDAIIAGLVYGKIRALTDYNGKRLKKALPSTPVEITGLSDVPKAGDDLIVCDSDKLAKQIALTRLDKIREDKLKTIHRVTLDDLFSQLQDGQVKELNIIIKADTQGSVEALGQSLEKLSTTEVKVNIIHSGVGAVNESDIMLASASNAIIIGFNIRSDSNITKLAEDEKIDVRSYRIIYQAIDDIKAAMAGLLEPEYKEICLGKAEVRAAFSVSKVGVIGGSYVFEGKITRNAEVRVVRDNVILYEGKISSLKRFKDDVKEVLAGYECGIGVENFNGLRPKDVIEAYELQAVMRKL